MEQAGGVEGGGGLAAEGLHELLAERQAEADVAGLAGVVGAPEAVEDVGGLFRSQFRRGRVGEVERSAVPLHRNYCIGRSIGDGVVEGILDYKPKQFGVGGHGGGGGNVPIYRKIASGGGFCWCCAQSCG